MQNFRQTLYLFLLITLVQSVHARTADFPSSFIFGVASAPGQVEDQLPDMWKEWGENGRIKSWTIEKNSVDRLKFWTEPQVEINLAKKLGAQSFRLGVDWGRVMPERGRFDEAAIDRYRDILKLIKAQNMKVMLTLMHHSVPKWVLKNGGWTNPQTKADFFFSLSVCSRNLLLMWTGGSRSTRPMSS